MQKVTDAFLDFAMKFKDYDNIPPEVAHETKRVLLDGLGNALGGISSDKGKIGVQIAHQTGGKPQSTLLGVGGRFSAGTAAFCNAELLNGLDMDPIPHIPPIVLPSVFAVAEAEGATGKQLIAALCVGQEIAVRLSNVLLSIMDISLAKTGKTPDVFGNSNEHIIGAAAANALLMGLDRQRVAEAMGISAYLCSLPVCRDWESTMPKTMIKYFPAAWNAQGAVQAAMLARAGYTGNAYTLDSEYGFPKFYCREQGVWDPEKVIDKLGERWDMLNYHYKPYPCCRFLHSILDCMYILREKYGLSPDEMTEVRCHTASFVPHPDQYTICNQVDAQFSAPYNMALAAYGYKPGPSWQDPTALTDAKILGFMNKVKLFVAPEYTELQERDPLSWYGRVEIDARGTTLTHTVEYSKGTNTPGYRLTDAEMQERFWSCAGVILPKKKADRAVELIMGLENENGLGELVDSLTL